MQEARVRPLVWDGPTRRGSAGPCSASGAAAAGDPEPRQERAALLQLEKGCARSSEDAAQQKPSKIMQKTY